MSLLLLGSIGSISCSGPISSSSNSSSSTRWVSSSSSFGGALAMTTTPSAVMRPRDPVLSPVVIVPGTGGNQLEAKLTEDYKASSPWCYTLKKDYFRLWLDLVTLFPPFTSCFADRLALEYDPITDQYYNAKGVETRVPYFGTTESMEYLDPSFKSISAYMIQLVNELTSKGYEKGRSLFGAPYDFRYAPGPRASKVAVEYQKDLKSLIEHAYTTNNKEPVVLVSHSMGCLWTLYFLNQQPMEWRHKFVAHFVTIAAPWGGVVEQMMTFASGNPEGVPFVNPLVIRKEQRSSESNLWLLPVSWTFGLRPLVITSSRSYTAADMEEFLNDIGFPEGIAPYQSRIPHLTEVLQAPKVPITLIYGFGVPTAETLSYDSKGFDYIPKIEMGDGDGTVNVCSLTAVISDWKNTQGQSLDVIAFPKKGHMKILQDKEALEVIVNTILNARPQQQLVV
jgi:hypothetical protein